MAENKPNGCWGIVGSILGVLILVTAIAKTCAYHINSSKKQAQDNLNYQIDSANLSKVQFLIFENAEYSIMYPEIWHKMARDTQAQLQGMLNERATICFAAWSLDRTMVLQIIKYHLMNEGLSAEEVRQIALETRSRGGLQPIVVSTEEVAVNGHPAVVEVVSHLTTDGLQAKDAILYLADGLNGWIIIEGGKSSTFDQCKALIDLSLRSFTLKK
jgi:hypothetical protein